MDVSKCNTASDSHGFINLHTASCTQLTHGTNGHRARLYSGTMACTLVARRSERARCAPQRLDCSAPARRRLTWANSSVPSAARTCCVGTTVACGALRDACERSCGFVGGGGGGRACRHGAGQRPAFGAAQSLHCWMKVQPGQLPPPRVLTRPKRCADVLPGVTSDSPQPDILQGFRRWHKAGAQERGCVIH